MIKNILIGWWRRFFKPPEGWEEDRLMKCIMCEDKVKIGPAVVCSHCGCPIKSKVRVKEEKCFKNKW